MREMLTGDLLATDLADRLAEAGVPFRKAHERVARFVGELEADSRGLRDATAGEIADRFTELGADGWQPSFEAAIARRRVRGGTAPQSVRDQIAALRTRLGRTS
jgi:argininosuccinate lyase